MTFQSISRDFAKYLAGAAILYSLQTGLDNYNKQHSIKTNSEPSPTISAKPTEPPDKPYSESYNTEATDPTDAIDPSGKHYYKPPEPSTPIISYNNAGDEKYDIIGGDLTGLTNLGKHIYAEVDNSKNKVHLYITLFDNSKVELYYDFNSTHDEIITQDLNTAYSLEDRALRLSYRALELTSLDHNFIRAHKFSKWQAEELDPESE